MTAGRRHSGRTADAAGSNDCRRGALRAGRKERRRGTRDDEILPGAEPGGDAQMIGLREVDTIDLQLAGDGGQRISRLDRVPVQRAKIGGSRRREPRRQPLACPGGNLHFVIGMPDGGSPAAELGVERLNLVDGGACPLRNAAEIHGARNRDLVVRDRVGINPLEPILGRVLRDDDGGQN